MGFGADTLNVEVFAYVIVNNYDEFLEVQEDLSLRIMDTMLESGCSLAFPSRTLYLGRDSGTDVKRRQAAEERAREWIDAGELPLPHFSPERIAALRGTIDYPFSAAATSLVAKRGLE